MSVKSAVFLHTAIVETSNLDSLARFYSEGLELGEPTRYPDHLGFDLENAYLGFDRVGSPRDESPGAVSLWFEVHDIQQVFERFVALGAKVKYGPTEKPWGATLAALLDPENNIIGLTRRQNEQ